MRKILCLETGVRGQGCIKYCYSNLQVDAIYAKGLWVMSTWKKVCSHLFSAQQVCRILSTCLGIECEYTAVAYNLPHPTCTSCHRQPESQFQVFYF